LISKFLRSRARSFRHAFSGWGYAFRTQPNAWIHTAFTLAVLIVCAWLRLPPRDFATIIVTITLVWTAELINTAIEATVDLASPNHHPLAKAGKDAAAGAVLVTAIGAILVGLLILGPPLWGKFESLFR
jgi:diacylglycerol kinase (ATP)